MNIYNHTQKSLLMLVVIILVIITIFYLSLTQGFDLFAFLIDLFIIILITSFLILNVKIDNKYLKIKFGYGIFRKKFLLKNIKEFKPVKNKWYYGWGIRLKLFPYTWIFNISGFDAIEITLKNDKIYRIGTDDINGFERALKKAIKSN